MSGLFKSISILGCVLLAIGACAAPAAEHHHEGEPEGVASSSDALSTINCSESTDTGYSKGKAFKITVVTVDGKKVERDTANAYYVMAQAAAKAGVNIKVISGFRTMAEQQYLYNCYKNCNCNNCNLAAVPGYSNHQSGHALDLNTSVTSVYNWLTAHAGKYGFKRTVPSEKWHWEWWSGGPGGGPCAVNYAGESLGLSGQSFPIASQGAVKVHVGETAIGWVKLKNIGKATWKPGNVWLAPIPRDKASPFRAKSWKNGTRISTVTQEIKPGATGQFKLDIAGSVPGESLLQLGWVAEGITWFADQGGPKDGYFAVKVNVLPAKPGGSGGSNSGGSGGAGAAGSGGSGLGGAPAGGTGGGFSTGSTLNISGGGGSGNTNNQNQRPRTAEDSGSCSLSQASARTINGYAMLLMGLSLLGLRRRRRD